MRAPRSASSVAKCAWIAASSASVTAPAGDGQLATKDLLIIDYSGDLEKVWATMILASTSAAMAG